MAGVRNVLWDPSKFQLDERVLSGCYAVINLAGYSISNRWTAKNKKMMVDSRINSTRTLVAAIQRINEKPEVFISASASGYYPSSDTLMNENSPAGNDFVSELTASWEAELLPLKPMDVRSVTMRIGVVLNEHEGAIGKMLPFFKWGLGSAVGSGKQLMSWIHLQDVCGFILHAIQNDNVQGVYNLSSPQVVTNKEFSAALAAALKKPFFLPNIPAFILKLLFGEMGSLVLDSKNMDSSKIAASGFQLQYVDLKSALNDLFRPH